MRSLANGIRTRGSQLPTAFSPAARQLEPEPEAARASRTAAAWSGRAASSRRAAPVPRERTPTLTTPAVRARTRTVIRPVRTSLAWLRLGLRQLHRDAAGARELVAPTAVTARGRVPTERNTRPSTRSARPSTLSFASPAPSRRLQPDQSMPREAVTLPDRIMEKLKGLILSGGAGTRLRPITHTSAKQLVPVANKPVLFYGIEALVEAGVTEIGIIIAPQTGDEIREAVGDGSALGAQVTYIPQAEPLGLAHAVLTAEEFLGDDSFVMYLGDNLLRDGIQGLVDAFRSQRARRADPAHPGPRPRALRRRRARRRADRPPRREAEGPALGPRARRRLHVHPEGLRGRQGDRALTARRARDHRHDPAPDRHRPHRRAAPRQGLVEGHRPARRHARGQPPRPRGPRAADRRRAHRLQGRGPRRHRGGRPASCNSQVRGPAVIGAGSTVTDSYIGPYTAIDADCEVANSEIEHSILLAGASVRDLPSRMEASLLGRNVKIATADGLPKTLRMIVGDQSELTLP